MRIPTVENMYSRKGTYNKVANQYVITMPNGDRVFQSYQTIIAVKHYSKCHDVNCMSSHLSVTLDKDAWNYSVTTSSYRNEFLGENTAETRKKIKSGEYKLAKLN